MDTANVIQGPKSSITLQISVPFYLERLAFHTNLIMGTTLQSVRRTQHAFSPDVNASQATAQIVTLNAKPISKTLAKLLKTVITLKGLYVSEDPANVETLLCLTKASLVV